MDRRGGGASIIVDSENAMADGETRRRSKMRRGRDTI